MKTSDAKRTKFDAALSHLFAQVAEQQVDGNDTITFIMRAAKDHTPANITIVSGADSEIKTARGKINDVKQLETDDKVHSVEMSRRLGLK